MAVGRVNLPALVSSLVCVERSIIVALPLSAYLGTFAGSYGGTSVVFIGAVNW